MKAKYIPMSIAQITKETNTVAMHRILAILACEMAGLTFPVAMDALAYNYEGKTNLCYNTKSSINRGLHSYTCS